MPRIAALAPGFLLLLITAIPLVSQAQSIPSGIPLQAAAAMAKAKQWRADAILVMVEVYDFSRSGKFALRFSFYSPSDQTGLWVTPDAPGGNAVHPPGPVNWGTQAIPKNFLDLPAAVQQARAIGMQGPMDHAILRVWPNGLAWRVASALDPNVRVYDIAAASATTNPQTPERSGTLIVPGQRVGPVFLGMSAGDAVKSLGQPETCNTNLLNGVDITGSTYCEFRRWGVAIVFHGQPPSQLRDRRAIVITVSTEYGNASRRYATDRGIRTGSSMKDVLRAYGTTYRKFDDFGNVGLSYDGLGISFTLLSNNTVQKIEVSKPGQ